MNVIAIATAGVIGYLCGSLVLGDILSRIFHGVDIYSVGSKNPGFTNVARAVGLRTGIVTLASDIGKGALAVAVARWVLAGVFDASALVLGIAAGVGAIMGHCWPLYHRFRGGKGVATGLGVFLSLAPLATAIAFGTWALALILLRYMSLASILGALALPVAITWIDPPGPGGGVLIAVAWIVGLGIVLRHRTNLSRLLRNQEPKFNLKRR